MTGRSAGRAMRWSGVPLTVGVVAVPTILGAILAEKGIVTVPGTWLPDVPAAVLGVLVAVAVLVLSAGWRRSALGLGLLVVVLPVMALIDTLATTPQISGPQISGGRIMGIEAPAWVLAGMSLLLLTSRLANAARLALCLNGAGLVAALALPLLSVWMPLSLPGADANDVVMTSPTWALAVHAALVLHALSRSRATPRPDRRAGLLIGTVGGFSILASAVWCVAVWRDHCHIIAQYEEQTQSVARVLEEHARRSLGQADMAAGMLADVVAQGVEPLTADSQVWRVVRDAARMAPQISAMTVVDAQGFVHLHSYGQPTEAVDVSDRDYFHAHRDDMRDVFVGRQVPSRLRKIPIFSLSRALKDASGRFAGVVVVSLRVDYFRDFYRGVALPTESMIGLYRRGGDMLAREPVRAEMLGRSVAGCMIQSVMLSRSAFGSAVAVSPIDGTRRLMSYRHLPELEVFVVVGIPWSHVVEAWAMRIAGYGGVLLALLGGLAALAWRQLRMIAQQQSILSQLEESEQRYRAVVQDQSEFISRCTADGAITFANQTLCRHFCETLESCIGQSFLRLLPEDDHAKVLDLRRRISPAEPTISYEYRFRDAAGAPRWHEWTDRGLFDDAGRLLGLQSVGRDITLRKHAEIALHERNAMLKQVIETLPDALYLHDVSGVQVMANSAAAAMFGHAAAPPDLWVAGEISYPLSYSARFHRGDGSPFLGEVWVRPLRGNDTSAPSGYVTLVRDISAAVEVGRAVQQARADAETANAAKTRFLAVASHDLRQPLHATNLFIDSLGRRVPDGEARDLVADAQKSLDSLDEMFGHLLDMCRLDAGVVPPQVGDVPISRVLEAVATQGRIWAKNKGIRFTAMPCAAVVATDPLLLERILRNLVVNAVRYTQKGGILVGCRRRANHLLLEVWDTGRGIPEDELDNVFLEFYRLEHSGRRGLGLGLTIVKRLADVLGHALSVRTHVGKGSVFRLALPLSAADTVIPVDHAAMLAAGDLSGVSIALLDDDGDVLRSTAKLFADWGCRVWSANSPEALDRMVNEPPDILVTDYELRGSANGLEVAAAFRRRFDEHLPVLIITGNTQRGLIAAAKAHHCRVLHKPLRPMRLRSMMALMVHADEVDPG